MSPANVFLFGKSKIERIKETNKNGMGYNKQKQEKQKKIESWIATSENSKIPR